MSEILLEYTGEAVSRLVHGVHLLVPIQGDFAATGYTIELNESGHVIWEFLDAQRPESMNQVVEFVKEKYEIPRELAQEDVRAFLSTLQSASLICITG